MKLKYNNPLVNNAIKSIDADNFTSMIRNYLLLCYSNVSEYKNIYMMRNDKFKN